MAPLTRTSQTIMSFWFAVNLQLRCLTWIAALRQKVCCFWARIFLNVVSGLLLVLSSDGLVFGTLHVRSSLCATVCPKTCEFSKLSTVYSNKLSSRELLTLSDVFDCNNAAVAWCLTPARCAKSKSNLESLRRHRECCPVKSVRSRIHLRASQSARIVKGLPLRYGQRRSTSHTIARHSRCVASYKCPVLVSDRDQYPIGFVVLSDYFCKKTQPTYTMNASVSRVRCPPKYGGTSTEGVVSTALRVSIASSFPLL